MGSLQPGTGRYARYKAFLTAGSSGTLTPDFTKVQLTHGGTSTSMLQVFAYDAAGNMTSKTTETASGVSTDVRDDAGWSAGDRINDLSQVKKQVVTPAGGSAVTGTYSYNSNGVHDQQDQRDGHLDSDLGRGQRVAWT